MGKLWKFKRVELDAWIDSGKYAVINWNLQRKYCSHVFYIAYRFGKKNERQH